MRGAIKMNFSKTITNPEVDVVRYYYKVKKQKSFGSSADYLLNASGINASPFEKDFHNASDRLTLYPNSTDNTKTYVVIKFHLPQSSDTELILMDSDERETISLIHSRLEAGDHELITEIRNEELRWFTYYYKLRVNGKSEVRKMKFAFED
jgi:hypothetical protein